ncbi:hypothetical protein TBLA_0B03270 [Henningerozyma blattae CBS 6284]|uniref:Vanadate resistance protein n=1 Tax=Henningerozyma blattae (strain ATCC 34711 / CBS 6284 / DSM 70876 / NBRC 10599 / NRRL Y-10934 / UCD 77-7) TaxID=1071380 RepID=I2GYG6_HENB6|nr:hypothetical protein TBLA_0B03270 [Tetrapisispora blattae CBS 6284]CCH59168.1 hypothetical protein TBLA_0B03270 [Tetrapisispora blattae CBS 6284]
MVLNFSIIKEKQKQKDELPTTRSKLYPKKSVYDRKRRSPAFYWTCILATCLAIYLLCKATLGDSSFDPLSAINNYNSYGSYPLSRSSNKNYKNAKELEDVEYYDYDFRSIDEMSFHNFDQGEQHYLITQYGGDVVTSKDKERYIQEMENLLSSSVDKYDLSQFEGTANGAENREHLLYLTPLRDAEHVLPMMFKHLMNLTYPHELIDIAFLVSDCSEGDKTLDTLITFARHLQDGTLVDIFKDMDASIAKSEKKNENPNKHYLKFMDQNYIKMADASFAGPHHNEYNKPFRSVQIFQKDFGQIIGQGFSDRHAVKVQGIRRKLMGRARNWLTANALKPYHSWVYWRDADVELCPGSVIQDLMSKNYDVIVPNVWRPLPEFLNKEQPYDLNSWMESGEALELAKTLDEDDVIVEGYAEYPTWRVHLAYLRDPNGDPNQTLDIDGVGGVSILAKAKLFRHGVHFPAFTFENHAETEAFGKMAKKMGYSVGGLPNYMLWHIYEPSDDDLKDMAAIERGEYNQN